MGKASGGLRAKWWQCAEVAKFNSGSTKHLVGGVDPQHQQRLNYILGKTAAQIKSQIPTTDFRTRVSLMGDIVNSSPVFVGRPHPYSFSQLNTDLKTSYAGFVAQHNSVGSLRDEMIYVGANDGMLHGFDTAGVEKMAFVPSTVFSNFSELEQV